MAKKKFLMDEDEMDAILDSDIAALDQGHSDQKILDIVRAGGQGLTAAQDFYEIPGRPDRSLFAQRRIGFFPLVGGGSAGRCAGIPAVRRQF